MSASEFLTHELTPFPHFVLAFPLSAGAKRGKVILEQVVQSDRESDITILFVEGLTDINGNYKILIYNGHYADTSTLMKFLLSCVEII